MPVKILVVDDEPDLKLLIQQKFRRQIRDGRFDFVFAHNGVEALAQLDANPNVDLVLSDINMPEMDGLTLLTKLPQSSNQLKAVMVSAYGDLQNIRTAMNRGAFDFLVKRAYCRSNFPSTSSWSTSGHAWDDSAVDFLDTQA